MKHTNEERAVLAAVATMPFGGLVTMKLADGPVTLGRVAEYLESLRGVLSHYVEEHKAEHAELVQFRGDVAALRRLLGERGDR